MILNFLDIRSFFFVIERLNILLFLFKATFIFLFNGFFSDNIYEVEDDPIMTMYGKETNKEFLVA